MFKGFKGVGCWVALHCTDLSMTWSLDNVIVIFNILPAFFHLLRRWLGRTLSARQSGRFGLGLELELDFEVPFTLLSRETLRLLILSSKFIFLLEKVLSSAFWCSSSHHANALLKSLILFLYFLGKPWKEIWMRTATCLDWGCWEPCQQYTVISPPQISRQREWQVGWFSKSPE